MIKAALLILLTSPAVLLAQSPTEPASVAVAAGTQAAKPKIVCRRSVDTGSLVRSTRRCMAAKDWEMVNRVNGDAAREVVRTNTGLVNGN